MILLLLTLLIQHMHFDLGPYGFDVWLQAPHIVAGIGYGWGGPGWDNGLVTYAQLGP